MHIDPDHAHAIDAPEVRRLVDALLHAAPRVFALCGDRAWEIER